MSVSYWGNCLLFESCCLFIYFEPKTGIKKKQKKKHVGYITCCTSCNTHTLYNSMDLRIILVQCLGFCPTVS